MPSRPRSIWRRSPNKLRQSEIWLECLCYAGLFAMALVLFLVNLGSLPLLDMYEGTLAQVAKEIYQSTPSSLNWIFPSLWGRVYLEQPPLIHDLVAIAYSFLGVNEFATRLPGALLGAISVVLVYSIGREIFVARLPASLSALVYLTCLPVVRYGRLASPNGALLCFGLLTVWGMLRSRRDLKWTLVIGIGLGLAGLTKGLFGVQLLAIVILFLLWDTPRLITSIYFWLGLILGATPGIAWYVWGWFRYDEFITAEEFWKLFLGQTSPSFDLEFSPQYYLLQILQYILPWSIVMFTGLKSLERNLHWGWAKLLVVWIGGYFTLGFLVLHQDYWFVLPLYPALALLAGRQLNFICNLPSYVAYPRIWVFGFASMSVVAAAGLNWGLRNYLDFYLPFICGSLCITFAATAIAIERQDRQFIPLLFWGLLVSIFLLVVSPHWIWELKSAEPIKPIADFVRQHTPPNQIVYSSMSTVRPSLDFYSDRQVIPQTTDELKQQWQQNSQVYLLIDLTSLKQLDLPGRSVIPSPPYLKWVLVVKKP